jgi:hypothetical protein
VLKDVHIAASRVAVAALFTGNLIDGTHEGKELTWNDPVKVTILNFFIVFILLDIEGLVIIPSLVYCKLKSLDTMLHSTLVETFTLTGVTVSSQ